MATILQVNANTAQAVGAFNNLANAIANARGQMGAINLTINQGTNINRQYGSSITNNIHGAFDRLSRVVSVLHTALNLLGTALQLVFSSLLKELDKLQGFAAVMSVTTKSTEIAAEAFNFLRSTADQLGVQFDAISNNYAKLTAAIPEGAKRMEIAEKVFLGIAMAARTLHSSNQDTQLMFYAVTQIASKGIVSMEELRRQLGEKLPGAIQIAARALNTTPELLEAAIRKGIVISEKFLPLFGDGLIRTFVDSSEKASQSVSAALNRLTNVWIDFVKQVLDSGAGKAIADVFDLIREKVKDTYLIERFSLFVKSLAEEFGRFISRLTAEDIRNGFDTFVNGVNAAVVVVDKLVTLFTWVINNATKAGAIIGAIGGAATGMMVAGPWGALAGAIGGGAVGAYAGNSLQPTNEQLNIRKAQDAAAAAAAAAVAKEQGRVLEQYMNPLMQQFKMTYDKVPGLLKSEAINMSTVSKMVAILGDKRFKTDAARQEALVMLSKSGQVLAPNTAQLSDVLGGNGKPKKRSSDEKRLDANMWRAYGFDGDFLQKWNDYNRLKAAGKLTTEGLEAAQAKLLSQQPFMEAMNKANKEAQEQLNKEVEQNIDLAFRQVAAREDVYRSLQDDLNLAKMRDDEYRIESRVIAEINRLADAGVTLRPGELELIREKVRLIDQTREITQAENGLIAESVDRFRSKIVQIKAMNNLLADPSSGYTREDQRNTLVNQNPELFAGTDAFIETQKSSWKDLFSYIKFLRAEGAIDAQTHDQMVAQSTELMTQRMIQAYAKVADERLQLGSGTWADSVLVSLNKVSAGFTTFASGATNAMGQFFVSFTDGFANSVGKAIVYSDDLGDALNTVAKEALAGLISAVVKLGMQWLINAAIGQTIAQTSAATALATTTAVATASAAAWAPAAALASLATLGTNSAAAIAGMTATMAVSEALALTSLAGFSKGGFTGYGSTSGISGFVHGREFVVNADATARNRGMLEAMNRGAQISNGGLKVSIVNNAPGVEYEVNQLTPDEVEIIATRVVNQRTPGLVANEIRRPSSKVSKSLATNTSLVRKY